MASDPKVKPPEGFELDDPGANLPPGFQLDSTPAPSLGVATHITVPETIPHRLGREAVGALPALGATLGGGFGMAGGPPMAVAGATAGAGLGESARQLVAYWFPDLATAPPSSIAAALETVKQAGLGGATEGAGPYIGKLFSWISGPVARTLAPGLERSAARGLRAVMEPAGRRAEGESLRASEGLVQGPASDYLALTRAQLEARAARRVGTAEERKLAAQQSGQSHTGLAGTVGREIGTREVAASGQVRPIQDVYDALQRYEDTLYMPPTQGQFGITSQPRLTSPEKLAQINKVRDLLQTQEVNGNISRGSLRMIRQDLDAFVRASSANPAASAMVNAGAVDPTHSLRAEAQSHMANAIREILNTDRPDIGKLNAEFSLWRSVQDAMSPTTLRGEFPKETSPWTQLWHARYAAWLGATAVGGAAGYHAGGTAGAAEAVGAVLAVSQLIHSTAWHTVSAATKSQIAKDLASGSYEGVAKLSTRLIAQRNVSDKEPLPSVRMEKLSSQPPSLRPPLSSFEK